MGGLVEGRGRREMGGGLKTYDWDWVGVCVCNTSTSRQVAAGCMYE